MADTAKQPGRFRWALRDKEAFQKYLERLKELTDFLHETLGNHQVGILLEITKETCMVILQMTNSIGEIREILRAIEVPTDRDGFEAETRAWLPLGDTVAGSSSEVVMPGRPQTLFAQLAQFRCNLASVQMQDELSDINGWDRFMLQEAQLEILDPESWVEWKTYERVRYRDAAGELRSGPDPRTTTRLKCLISILHMADRPSQFRVPLCAGCFDDE